jgi:FtsH-binding integral membrane protein
MNTILLLTFVGILALYKIYLNSDKKITASLILENTYTYLLLGLIISSITAFSIDKSKELSQKADSLSGLLGSFIIALITLFIIFSSGNSVGLRNVAWLIFMIAYGIMSHPMLTALKKNGRGMDVFLSLVIIVGALSLVAYKLPGAFLGWGAYLTIILFSLIVVEILDLLVGTREGLRGRSRIYGWVGVALFSGFLLYDTQRLVEQAKLGEEMAQYINMDNINYPGLSLSIYLDIANLFSSLTSVN